MPGDAAAGQFRFAGTLARKSAKIGAQMAQNQAKNICDQSKIKFLRLCYLFAVWVQINTFLFFCNSHFIKYFFMKCESHFNN